MYLHNVHSAMTNTLSLLNSKNQSHRKTLSKLDESSEWAGKAHGNIKTIYTCPYQPYQFTTYTLNIPTNCLFVVFFRFFFFFFSFISASLGDQYEQYKTLDGKCTKAFDNCKQKKRNLQQMEEDINVCMARHSASLYLILTLV